MTLLHFAGPTGVAELAAAELQDPEALAEIELYAELVIAASACPGPVSSARLDELLGVPRAGGGTGPVDARAARPLCVDLTEQRAGGPAHPLPTQAPGQAPRVVDLRERLPHLAVARGQRRGRRVTE